MRILAFADLHNDQELLQEIIKRSNEEDIEAVVCAGDFTDFGTGMKKVLEELNRINKPVIIVPGNHETPEKVQEEIKELENLVNLHKSVWTKDNVTFMGWGTDGFTKKSEDFRKTARDWRKKLSKENKDNQKVIVTHAPAHDTKLDEKDGEKTGNKDIRKEIERVEPTLHICGHIHSNEGKEDKIKETVTLNPGWKGIVLDI